MPEQTYEMTYEGIRDLQAELEERKTVTTNEIAERLKEARSLGDLSENSEYDDAKEAQANNELRIAEIEMILKNARVIDDDDISKDEVSLGSKVILLDKELKEEVEFILVSAREEDVQKNKISNESPVGSAILGRKKGDVITVKTPVGFLDYEILSISRP